MNDINDYCIEPDCTTVSYDEGLCLKHWDIARKAKKKAKGKDNGVRPAQSQVNAVEGEEQTVCRVCACHKADAKPHWNKKHGQCQKHLTNAANQERAKKKKAAKEDKPFQKCIASQCSEKVFKLHLCERHFEELPPEQTGIQIDLADYPEVFKNIKELAKDQIRSIPHQVIFILKDYFEVAEGLIRPDIELILPENRLCTFEGCTSPHGFQNDFCLEHSGGQS